MQHKVVFGDHATIEAEMDRLSTQEGFAAHNFIFVGLQGTENESTPIFGALMVKMGENPDIAKSPRNFIGMKKKPNEPTV